MVAEIQARGGNAVANYDNMALMSGGEAVIQQAVDAYGQLDILVNSAGMLRDRMIWQMTPEDWDRALLHNAKATFTATKFACILFRQQRGGQHREHDVRRRAWRRGTLELRGGVRGYRRIDANRRARHGTLRRYLQRYLSRW